MWEPSGTLPDKATWYLATQLARPRRPARGRQPAPGRGPGGDRADLRHAALDRAGLQAGQGRTGLGRLPGPLRSRDPPPQVLANCAFSFFWDAWFADHTPHHDVAEAQPEPGGGGRGGPPAATPAPPPSWPRAIRAIRAWLSPWIALQRWWAAWLRPNKLPIVDRLRRRVWDGGVVVGGCG